MGVANSVQEYFLRKFGHFTDLGGNGDSEGVLGSSLGGSILTPKSRVWRVCPGRLRNVSLAALNLR